MLYQGEDVAIRIKGDETVKFTKENFVVWIYTAHNTQKTAIELSSTDATPVADDDNAFDLVLSYDKTKDMPSAVYTIEVLLIDENKNKRTIFQNKEAFQLNYSRIKDFQQ